jgi:hypothetical protein
MSTSLRMLAQVTTAQGKAGVVRMRSRHEAVRAIPKACMHGRGRCGFIKGFKRL